MELSHLRIFKAVAQFNSFSKAAEFLEISQPVASRQLAELEEDLGVELFHRNRRQMEITRLGEWFLERSEHILRELDDSQRNLTAQKHGHLGLVRLGFLAYTSGPYLPALIRNFNEEYPGIRVILHEMNPVEMHRSLETGDIDLGLNREVPDRNPDRFESFIVSEDSIVAVLPEIHPLANREQLSLRELRDFDFTVPRRSAAAPLFDTIVQQCRNCGFSPKIVSETMNPHGAILSVAAGSTVTLSFAAMRFFFPRNVRFIPLCGQVPCFPQILEKLKTKSTEPVLTLWNYIQSQSDWIQTQLAEIR